MKRSRSIKLVLIGSLTAGALTSCGPTNAQQSAITVDRFYTNNYYVAGVGYYHAPFRAWYVLPYNHFDPQTRRYFFGGQWGVEPFQNITNISAPPAAVAQQAEARRSDVPRGGFGSTSRSSHVWS